MEYEQYLYVIQSRRRDGTQNLKCKFSRTHFCRGTGKVDPEGIFTLLRDHNHEPLDQGEEVQFRTTLVARAVRDSGTNLRVIYDEEARRNPVGAMVYTYRRAEGTMRAARRRTLPPVPQTLAELGIILSGDVGERYLCHGRYQQMLNTPNGSFIFFYCPDLIQRVAAGLQELHVDGTFKVVPSRPAARQLFTMHGIIQNTSVVMVYVLMSCRTSDAYKDVLQFIQNITPTMQPVTIMSDFEAGLQEALTYTWPDADIKGCYFHYCQAVWKKMSREGYLGLVNSNRFALIALKMLMALPLLPSVDMTTGFRAIEHYMRANEVAMERLTNYVNRYWLGVVPAERLSVFELPRRTNNNVESFHNKLKLKFGVIHPNVWMFVGEIQKYMKDDHILMGQLESGQEVRRGARTRFSRQNQAIIRIQREYRQGLVDAGEFLRRAHHVIDSLEERLRQWVNNVGEGDDEDDDDIPDSIPDDDIAPEDSISNTGNEAEAEVLRAIQQNPVALPAPSIHSSIASDTQDAIRDAHLIHIAPEDSISNTGHRAEPEVLIDEIDPELAERTTAEIAQQAVERAVRQNPIALPPVSTDSSVIESDTQDAADNLEVNRDVDRQGQEFNPEDFIIPEDGIDADWQLQLETFPDDDYNLHLEDDNEWQPAGEDEDANETDDSCPICLSRKMRFVLVCGHRLCGFCSERSFNPSRLDSSRCPVCRTNIAIPPIRYF